MWKNIQHKYNFQSIQMCYFFNTEEEKQVEGRAGESGEKGGEIKEREARLGHMKEEEEEAQTLSG